MSGWKMRCPKQNIRWWEDSSKTSFNECAVEMVDSISACMPSWYMTRDGDSEVVEVMSPTGEVRTIVVRVKVEHETIEVMQTQGVAP